MKVNRFWSAGLFAISMVVGCKKDSPAPAPAPAAAPLPEPSAACAATAKVDPASPDIGGCEILMTWAKNKAPAAYKCLATCQVAATTKAASDQCDATCAPEFAKLPPAVLTQWGSLNLPTPASVCESAIKNDPANPENATCVTSTTWLLQKYPRAYSCLSACELTATNKAESDKCNDTCKAEMSKITPADTAALEALVKPPAAPVADAGTPSAPAASDAGAPAESDAAAKPDDDQDGGGEAGTEDNDPE